MITGLQLSGQAAFGSTSSLGPLARINFVFGPNGSGKTSISRQFYAARESPDLASWADTERPVVHVFNRDYVDRTFAPERDLEGVFVLGEQSAEAQTKRESLRDDRAKLKAKISQHTISLGTTKPESGKKGELEAAREVLANAAWTAKQRIADPFEGFFAGFNGSRKVFLDEILRRRTQRATESEAESDDDSAPLSDATATYAGLLARFEILRSEGSDGLRLIEPPLDFQNGIMPTSELMTKPIMGRSDVPVAALIEKLGNSDWVSAGQAHLDPAEGLCPFCQQTLPPGFTTQLVEYFDRGFEEDLKSLADYQTRVEGFLSAVRSIITLLAEIPSDLSTRSTFEVINSEVTEFIRDVHDCLRAKRESPARVVEMVDGTAISETLSLAMSESNILIQERLDLIANRQTELEVLKTDVWNFLIDSTLATDLASYDATSMPLAKAVASLSRKLVEDKQRLHEIEKLIRDVTRSTISSAPVIERINAMLTAVGFTSFALAPSEQIEDGYRFVRDSGEIVGHTLSEGERSFVTFLYFVNQIEGLQPDLGLSREAIVIIDDPISSLDSDALFFVSTYLRSLLEEVAAKKTPVIQVVVLTHNVYFHKELTYKVENLCAGSQPHYFTIAKRKTGGNEIVLHENNPVSTAYAGLWRIVKDSKEGVDVPGVQNAMRRIVESYFEFIGKPLLNHLPPKFEEVDRLICRSLISWTHDGSHATSLLDAMDYSHSAAPVDQWLSVFEQLFILTDHGDHFEAMMK